MLLFVLSASEGARRFSRFWRGYLAEDEELDEGANKNNNGELAKEETLRER